ncbi:MAG TPA: hypothetical protein VMD53_13830 [Rhizomicrobium sp.]|nr:hypothetical protein [Rhizomicrobium sp.]
MRRVLFAAVAGSSFFAAALAFADDAKSVPPTPVVATDNADKLICKPVTHEGQLVGRSCRTQKEWDRTRFHEQQLLREIQQQGLFNTQ